MTYEEKKKIVEIAVEEVAGKVPLFAGAIDMTTEGIVRDAVTAKKIGVDGIFFIPPMGSGDITYAWNPEKYPEVWIDIAKAIDKAVNLPIIVHRHPACRPFTVSVFPWAPYSKCARRYETSWVGK